MSAILISCSFPLFRRTSFPWKILDVPLRGAFSVTRPLRAALLDRGRGYTGDVDPRCDVDPGGVE
jgi:hypothetical protein